MAVKQVRNQKLYSIVERLRSSPKPTSKEKKSFNFNDPTALRALRIHRHLRALEAAIVDDQSKKEISIRLDPSLHCIILTINIPEMRYSRVSYLTPEELAFLKQNRKVAYILRKCSSGRDVA